MPEPKPRARRSGAAPAKTRDDQVVDRRRSLLKAAVKVISKRGLTGVTINSIAAEAKCSYGVVAFHFQSKEGIIFAALDHTAAEYEAYLAQLNASQRGPAERIRHMIDTDFSRKAAGHESIALWLAFWAEAARVPSFRQRCAALRVQYNEAVAADVAELAALRGRTVEAEQVALTLNAMISGLWVENLLLPITIAEGQKRGHDASLAYLRLIFPEDF
ncbi:TetR family transcriptional regulator C-terminal domain-containing protein [Cereibacter johrii]|uniref:Transcriptional regulator /TetR family transcriptional regulator n=1 Tax=Cereibacter johrii TaxID=445629 RepID=A0ABX5J7F1_9RHOB|nr:TetR family transcriptional regulator C-terminal domain-containing protein [Cereibacter johrii]MEA5160663.1 TetR family transcriptional regulator C-terminal domain-containing protein [Cereibacter johrii]ODM44199.1 TetR family transcriptional regulator [Cereibacter johrii]PTM78506.1 transcriptional regulator /TetR family transcriptional regulator [Cereibacter johrii]RDS97077.1 TetR family transcriptional regulator [Cereibacter sphaeroides f. sp. denitrificans]